MPSGIASATSGTSVSITTPPSSFYWTRVSAVVTVTASSGPNPTSGTVVVSDSTAFGDFSCGVSLSGTNGTSCPGTYTAVGTDTITASYGGSAGYAASSGSVQVTVAQASVTLSVNATAATVGQTSTVTVQVNPGIGQNGSGALAISDQDGAVGCSTSIASGEAVCTSSALRSVGNDVITASWPGNADYVAATATTTLDVGQASTVVTSVTSPASQVGLTASITVQVEPPPDGGEVSVTDADGEVSGCSAVPVDTATGEAVCTTGTLTAADPTDALTAQYLGDANYAASGASAGSLTIDRGTTHLSLSADPSPTVGGTATYVATLGPVAAAAAGGTVSFSDSAMPARVSDCPAVPVDTATDEASCTSLTYSVTGSDTVSASFPGSANWAPSSAQLAASVAPGTPGVVVSLSPPQPAVGERVTVTATISPSDGGGTVAFSDSVGYLSGCSDVPVTGTTASCVSGVLTAARPWSLQANYSGDPNYNPVDVSTGVTISAAPTAVVLGANPANPDAFGPVTLTATVVPAPDGGTVDFTGAGDTVAGCGAVAVNTTTGVAACSVAQLAGAGTADYSAAYSGDGNYQASTGQLTLQVGQVPTTVLVAPSTNPVTAGSSTALTITVSPVPDGGSVTVTDSYGALSCSSVPVPTSGATAGQVSCHTGNLTPAGTDSLSARYTGTDNYTSSSGSASITVQRVRSVISIVTIDPEGEVGKQLHITAKVTPPPADATLAFSDSLGQLGGCASVGVHAVTGEASCVSGTLEATGPDQVTISFAQTPTETGSSVSTSVTIEEAPGFASPLAATVVAGTAADVQLAVSGYPAPTVAATAPLPNGLVLGGGGAITGTASAGTGGAYEIPLSAANGLATVGATLDLTVEQAPAIASPTDLSAPYGVESSFTLTAAAGTYPPAAYTLDGALPDGMSFLDNGDGTATISGSPGDFVSGSQSFTVVAANSAGSVRVPVTVDVTGTPAPPSGGGSAPGPGAGTGAARPIPPASPTSPSSGSGVVSQGTVLSPVATALAARRASGVPSAGRQPSFGAPGAIPAIYDPVAPVRFVDRDGRSVRVTVVALGRDRNFPALGNVGPYGDCAVVADSNIVRVDHILGRIAAVPKMTADEALSEWAALDGGSGAGLTDSQLLHAWAGPAGVLGTRLRGWTRLEATNVVALKRAILATGALYATVVVPDNLPLSSTIDPAISPTTEVAGHSLALFGWTRRGFLVVTWGEVALVPYSWWTQYAATAYAVSIAGEHVPASAGRS